MKKFLILAFACLSACLVHAQTPETITFPKGPYKANSGTKEIPCLNNAGTFVLGQKGVNTQSNDLTLDTIWLCRNDSIFINHNGDFNLNGDPNPLTPAGIGYAFYTCPPTVSGTTLNEIIGSPAIPPSPPNNPGSPGNPGDPCLLVTPTDPILVTSGNPNGDTWFFNSGFLQTTFNMGFPYLLHFAPITFDDATNNGYETTTQGGAPGDCVNVRTDQAFEVVYLNAVSADGITPSFGGNTCLGRFKLGGGYPEWDATALYDVKVYLKGNPSVKALINTPFNQLSNNVSVVFSVPVSGTYVIEIEDGKSCGFRGEIDMTACVNSDNVGFVLPNITGGPNETVCIPITTQNFSNIQGFSISMQWDPAVLQLQLPDFIQNINGDLTDFVPSSGTETSLVSEGYLGLLHSGALPATLTPTEVLMEVCFTVLAQTNNVCTPLTFINIPSFVSSFNAAGDPLAVEAVNGTFCSVFNPLIIDIDTIPPGCNDILFDYTVTVSGEEPPYEIIYRRITPPGPTGTITPPVGANTTAAINDLTPGTYEIIVTPQNGADIANADTLTLVVVQPEQLGAALNLTQLPKCSGEASGEVSVTVFLGTTAITDLTGYTLNWSPTGVPNPTGPVQTNVGAGVYTVTVTQTATGCTAIASGTLGNPPQLLNKVPTITPASCTGLANGCFTFELQGGTPFFGGQYMYDVFYLTEGGDTLNAGNFTGVIYDSGCDELAGNYLIVSTDANGCTFSYDLTIPTLRKIELTQNMALTQLPSCNGGSNGQLGVTIIETPATPAGNFFFTWVPGGTIVSTPLGSTASNLNAGCYFVAAVDVNGCNDTLTVCLSEPPVFTAVPITVTNPSCVNTTSGSISVIGQGGTGAPNTFTYAWSTGTGNIGSSISNLGPGTYTVTVRDANLCTAVFDTTLALPTPPAITSITQVDVRCGSDGSLTAIAPTATGFLWTSPTGNTIVSPNQANINNLMGGTYVIRVTDANFCTNTDTVTLVGVMPLAIIDTTLENPTCFGYLDGRISIGVEGGNPNYSFLWSVPPPNTINPISGLIAGSYTVTITDTKQCTLVGNFTLVEPPQIQLIPTTVGTSCFGTCDGEATIQANYPPNNNFNFIWSVAGSTDSVRNDLCAGTFTVTITETGSSQCFVIQEITIGTPPMIIAGAESSIDSVSCNGLSDGQISVSGEGGNGAPFTYLWEGGSTNSLQSNLMANTPYAVTITDKDGCTGTASFEVEEPGPIVISKNPSGSQELACAGDDNGAIALTVQGGNAVPNGGPGQYTYIWSDGNNQIGTTNPLEMLSAGAYLVTVSDYKSCTGTTSITLNDPPFVVGAYQLGDPLKCFGDETSISIVAITGGSGAPYSYTVDFGVPLSPTLVSSISGGEHYITYIDNKNCEVTDTIDVPEPEEIKVNFNPSSIEIQLGDTLRLSPELLGATVNNLASFEWSPAEFVKDPTEFYATMYTFESGTLMLTVIDSNGCTGKGSLMVEVDLNRNIYIPNVFIPNDNLNRLFGVGGGIGVEKVNYMRVYDRWGELMYDQNNFLPEQTFVFNNGWDGRHNGKLVNPGVYVYAVEVLFVDGKKLLYRGDVTVVR